MCGPVTGDSPGEAGGQLSFAGREPGGGLAPGQLLLSTLSHFLFTWSPHCLTYLSVCLTVVVPLAADSTPGSGEANVIVSQRAQL